MSETELVKKIYKSRNTLLEHLDYRNFDIRDYKDISISTVYKMYNNDQLDMILQTNKNGSESSIKKVYIKYHLGGTLKVSQINHIIDDLFDLEEILKKKDDLIIVMNNEPNETIQNALKKIWETEGIYIIIWSLNALQINVLKHCMVPSHRVLSEDEKESVMIKYSKNNKDFPDISIFSPPAMAIGLRPGEICEILRPSPTSIVEVFYRICKS